MHSVRSAVSAEMTCVRRALSSSAVHLHKKIVSTGRGVSSNMWLTRQLNDPYVMKARRENFRSRASFKLAEIQQRHCVMAAGDVVVDCGSAPGGWSQVAARAVACTTPAHALPRHKSTDRPGGRGVVVAVDTTNMASLAHVHFVRGDFTSEAVRGRILQVIEQCGAGETDRAVTSRQVNVVLSDMAPNMTGVKQLDHERIVALCYAVVRFSLENLLVGGNLIFKVFAGGKVDQLFGDVAPFFSSTRIIKPDASRANSSELYILASKFRGAKR